MSFLTTDIVFCDDPRSKKLSFSYRGDYGSGIYLPPPRRGAGADFLETKVGLRGAPPEEAALGAAFAGAAFFGAPPKRDFLAGATVFFLGATVFFAGATVFFAGATVFLEGAMVFLTPLTVLLGTALTAQRAARIAGRTDLTMLTGASESCC